MSDDDDVLNVTLWQLKKEDSGWYYCSNKDSQMPVHVTVMEAPNITQFTTKSSYSTIPLSADRQFLWLLILGVMLPITFCGAVMLIKAKNKRKQRAESSNLHDDMNKQQLPKGTEKNCEVAYENLYEFMTENKPNTQGNGKNNEVACEDLYEFMTENKPNTQGNGKNKEVACEDLYEIMNGIKQNTQLTATDNKNIYTSMVRKVKM